MPDFAQETLAAVRTMLPDVASGTVALRPVLLPAEDGGVDDEIAFLGTDGRRHLVSLQVGTHYVGTSVAGYETTDLGDGLSHVAFAWVRPGEMSSSLGDRLRKALKEAFASSPDAFEPLPGPSVGSHPHLPALVRAIREAVADSSGTIGPDGTHRLALNPLGATPDGNDVVTLDAADGTSLIAAMTRPGGYAFLDPETGAEIVAIRVAADAGRTAEFLAEAVRSAPGPTP